MKQLLVAVLLLGLSFGCILGSSESVPDLSAEQIRRIDGIFQDLDRTDSAGCSLGVLINGRFARVRGYGMANLEYGIANSGNTVFRIGSTSKQFTAAAIALLANEGKVSLDADVRTYLPEMPDYGEPVTVRHLVHHISGVRDYLVLMDLAGLRDDDYYTDDQVIEMLSRQKELNFPVGTQFLYSNSNYFLMAEIVKRVTGQTLREYAQRKIFGPLGMEDTHFHNDHRMIVPNRASGYSRLAEGGFEINMTTLDMIGDGGVFTTVRDLAKWDANFYSDQIGFAGFLEQMQSPGVLKTGDPTDYAFGLRVSRYRGLKTVSHGGAFVGYRAELLRFPEQKVSVICLCNLAQTNPSRLAEKVAEIVLEDRMEAEPVPDRISSAELAKAVADRLLGDYEREDGQLLRILRRSGSDQLWAEFGSGFQLPLKATAQGELRSEDWPGKIEFDPGELPMINQLRVSAGNTRRVARRITEGPPGREDLHRVTGRYYSPELNANYDIEFEGEGLSLKVGMRPSQPLILHKNDPWRLHAGGQTARLDLDDTGRVRGFTLDAGRVSNLKFVRSP